MWEKSVEETEGAQRTEWPVYLRGPQRFPWLPNAVTSQLTSLPLPWNVAQGCIEESSPWLSESCEFFLMGLFGEARENVRMGQGLAVCPIWLKWNSETHSEGWVTLSNSLI